MLCAGDVLGGRYRLDEPIADGGMGEVWRATDVSLTRTVAVKVLRPALVKDPDFDTRFRSEARMMAALTHPNVVNVYDYGRSALNTGGNIAYLVMAYVDGDPLSRRIVDSGRLSVAETMSVVAQAADALHAAHMHGIIHRDVKPGNLLVQPDGAVKLVDFGVARSPAVTQITTANAILGTAMYMAPEQASGHPVSPATDIYALGAVAFHCLAGHPPFNGETPLEIALQHVSDPPPPLPGDIPPRVQMLVARTLAKNPADRYPTAAAFAATARAVTANPNAIRSGAIQWAVVPSARTGAPRTGPAAARSVTAASAAAGVAAAQGSAAQRSAAQGSAAQGSAAQRSAAQGTATLGPAVAASTVQPAELDPPTTPDLPALLTQPPSRLRRGPRLAAVLGVAGVAAAVVLGLAAFGGLVGLSRPAGTSPADRAEQTGAPMAPVANPSTTTPTPSSQTAARPAVPVRASTAVSAPAPTPTTSRPTPSPAAPAATAVPTPTAAPVPPPAPGPTAVPTESPSAAPSAPPADPPVSN
ncbi:hypothetical protein GCM10009835_30100 [Planosporangium flavigriseum]|uniref:non-specific serine/threonine protein kinase n=2 Tax=Planosporangium flavigriseum TaxID=373681 RepID=A0A8J3M203_9ACTN|nr:serine/threonine-protein kinase [Planosporangium flavigriseum]GIG75255.1 hypothetical protein Pfl04_36590 [Planosporangium flavigriseum]